MHPASREQPPLVSNREMATQETDPAQQKKKQKKKKDLAFISVGATAPLEGDIHFTRQRTEQEVEEKKNLL